MLKLYTYEFLKSLDEAIEKTKEKLVENMGSTLELVHNTSNELAPFDTGEMRDNSGYFVRTTDTEIVGTVGYLEFYSIYVHQGTGLFALNGDGRQTPWWWKGTTEKWEGWHYTHGQKPKRFLYKAFAQYEEEIPILLAKGS